ASLSFDEFCDMICTKYKNNLSKAYYVVDDYLTKMLNLNKTGDMIWEIGAKNLILASILYLLNDNQKTFNLKDVLKFLELDVVSDNRQQNLITKIGTAPTIIQSCVAGCIESHPATFRGYISVAAELLHQLAK
ncbi:MAG: hypothetical protein IJU58_02840, partial [Clostridia bacterium]|nr:hypothetical protein [Clostridia bacterium]